MAKNEIAAMLDELMGRNRNAHPNEKVADITWEDSSVCKYFLVDFCPHDLFTNTKVDLGVCPRIHDEELKKKYETAKEGSKKMAVLDEFISYCQKMMNDLSLKIKRSKERLLLTQMEQAAAAGMSKQQQEEVEMKIQILTDKINHLVDQAEKAGCQGDVEEAQGVLKLCDQLRVERDELKLNLGIKPLMGSDKFAVKKMEVCEICGAFLIVGDAQSRIDDHLMGKQHAGYTRLKTSLEASIELRKKKREEREKEREEWAEERRKGKVEDEDKEEENEGQKKRSRSSERRSHDRKSHDRKRSRSRDRKRSRSRDRRRRSRSKDRRRRSRSRSRDGRRGRRY